MNNDFNEELWLEKIRQIIVSTLSYSRCFATLDQDDIPVIYDALDAPNWKQGEYLNCIETPEDYESSETTTDVREYIRISQLDQTTYYERFNESAILLERKSTNKFKELPVICFGATDLSWNVDSLPLEGIATCALHIYKKSADLSYAEYSSCVPTLVMTGVDDDATKQSVGGGVALMIASDLAKVYYPATDTNALQHVKLHIDGLFEEAKTYGASLLGGDKNEVESAEAIRLRQGAAGASLSTLTRNVERGVNKLLQLAGINYKFKINFDLEDNYLTPAEKSVLLDAWMNNAISHKTLFNNYQKSGLVEDERSYDSELDDIKKEKEERAADMLNQQRKLTSVKDNNVSNYDVAKKSTTDLDNPADPSSAARTKNLNREGSDYQTK